jgi:hypothetical protein
LALHQSEEMDLDPVDVFARTERLLAEVSASGVVARVLGGVAIAMRCPSARTPPLARAYHDIDVATTRRRGRELGRILIGAGFHPNERFNAIHGRSRMIFASADGLHLDVLVGEFAMCHRLDLTSRLTLVDDTLPLADLALTKLQIAELNAKDVQDLAALFLDHRLVEDETGINAARVAEVLSRDWGWWRTVTANLDLLEQHLPGTGLDHERIATVSQRLHELRDRISRTKKSLGWKSRAKLGDRISWREEPEEIATG